jgi:phenylalanyl-tRNA synthetase beta chain
VLQEGMDEIRLSVPFSKPDISLPADIVEEIVRIDGLDNIDIPTSITISPAIETLGFKETLKEKLANYLVGKGFNEIFTNSITNSKYFNEEVLQSTVKMMNNLSADLDVLRPSMLETGLESLAYNINRKNSNLSLFEFGKLYSTNEIGKYKEEEHLSLYITGVTHEDDWKEKSRQQDFYAAKGIANVLLVLSGLDDIHFEKSEEATSGADLFSGKNKIGLLKEVSKKQLNVFDIKQTVYFIDLNYELLLKLVQKQKIVYKEVAKFPAVQRDLALVVDRNTTYEMLEAVVKKTKLSKLQSIRLFDVFESDKIGVNKKSMALNFTFLDEEKTLTDKEIDGMINKLIQGFEKELSAEIRK